MQKWCRCFFFILRCKHYISFHVKNNSQNISSTLYMYIVYISVSNEEDGMQRDNNNNIDGTVSRWWQIRNKQLWHHRTMCLTRDKEMKTRPALSVLVQWSRWHLRRLISLNASMTLRSEIFSFLKSDWLMGTWIFINQLSTVNSITLITVQNTVLICFGKSKL